MPGFSLTNVHLSCFVASYAAALLLELFRVVLRAPARIFGTLSFTGAGVFAQTIYIALRTTPNSSHAPPLSGWFDWLLLVAWGLAIMYLILTIRRREAAYGVFMLPLVLLLIAVATLFREAEPFPRGEALYVWGMLHGAALLLGLVVALVGFILGVMYLIQSRRLKMKIRSQDGLKMPSLEWLQQAARKAQLSSSWMIGAGLLAGVMMNVLQGPDGLPWTDPVVWTSGLLLAWLIAVLKFESSRRPAQHARTVVYLTLANFVVLAAVLAAVLLAPSRHANSQTQAVGVVPSYGAAQPAGGGAL